MTEIVKDGWVYYESCPECDSRDLSASDGLPGELCCMSCGYCDEPIAFRTAREIDNPGQPVDRLLLAAEDVAELFQGGGPLE